MFLFVLSKDNLYLSQLQQIIISTPDWFLDKRMGNCTLLNIIHVSCTYLLVFNATGLKDTYIQSTCLTILYHLTTSMKQIHPYVAQKFIAMMESFYKKFLKEHDEILLKVVVGCIEILNACIATTIKQNTNLVYCIIYKQNLFESISQHESFTEYCHNLKTVFFYLFSYLTL